MHIKDEAQTAAVDRCPPASTATTTISPHAPLPATYLHTT